MKDTIKRARLCQLAVCGVAMKSNVGLVEFFYSTFAKFFYALWAFCRGRATTLETARMQKKYVGRYVIVKCGQTHYGKVLDGLWFVKSYDADAGDLKITPAHGDDEKQTWVTPECVEIFVLPSDMNMLGMGSYQ